MAVRHLIAILLAIALISNAQDPQITEIGSKDQAPSYDDIKCEIDLSRVSAELLGLKNSLSSEENKKKAVGEMLVQAEKAHSEAQKQGFRESAGQYARKLMGLKSQLASFKSRDLEDNKYKAKFAKLRADLPMLKTRLKSMTQDTESVQVLINALQMRDARLQARNEALLAENDALSKQFPLTRQVIDNKYAKILIPSEALAARLAQDLHQVGERTAQTEAEILHMAKALKAFQQKLKSIQDDVKSTRQARRSVMENDVASMKSAEQRRAVMTIDLRDQQTTLKQNEKEFDRERKDALSDAADASARAADGIASDAIKQQEEGEAQVEAVEGEGKNSARLDMLKQAHAKLEQQVREASAKASQQIEEAQRAADLELDALKADIRKKMNAQQVAMGMPITKPASNPELAAEQRKVENRAKELRKAVAPISA